MEIRRAFVLRGSLNEIAATIRKLMDAGITVRFEK
jgi:hypothetical protein